MRDKLSINLEVTKDQLESIKQEQIDNEQPYLLDKIIAHTDNEENHYISF